jgi:RHS repeat-associated protein
MIGKVNVYWDSTLVEDPSGEGEFWNVNRTDERSYFVKDHLGSVRITFSQDSTVILNAQDYYPFGETMRVLPGNPYQNRYKFTEKERDDQTGYDYFGARYYDSELGRWLSVDPLAEIYPDWSPYNYCFNNPINIIDYDGRDTTGAKVYWLPEITVTGLRYSMDHYVNMGDPFSGLQQFTTDALDAFENWTGWKLGVGRTIIEAGASPGFKIAGFGLVGKLGKNLTNKVGKMAAKWGKTSKEINRAIELAKRDRKFGSKQIKNSDIEVDLDNGDIFLRGEYINNIFDYLK